MCYKLLLLFLLPLSALAQIGPPCTPQLVISYDAAGNRIQRKEVCGPGGAGTNSAPGEGFRIAAPAGDSLTLTVSPNPGAVFMVRLAGAGSALPGPLHVQVYTWDGRLIHAETLGGETYKLDLRAFPDGAYLLRVRCGREIREEKLVKRE
jgi:hypothetical protein